MRFLTALLAACIAASANAYDNATGIANLDNPSEVLARVKKALTTQDCYTLALFYAKQGDRKNEHFWLVTGCLAGSNFQCSLAAHNYEKLPDPRIAKSELLKLYGIACNRPKKGMVDRVACDKLFQIKHGEEWR